MIDSPLPEDPTLRSDPFINGVTPLFSRLSEQASPGRPSRWSRTVSVSGSKVHHQGDSDVVAKPYDMGLMINPVLRSGGCATKG